MSDPFTPSEIGRLEQPPAPPPPPKPPKQPRSPESSAAFRRLVMLLAGAALMLLLVLASLLLAWTTQRQLRSLEPELVRRQQDSQIQAGEARLLARGAQDAAREAAAKVALLDARVAENTMQRTQVEELMQSLSRSRDENVVADVEAAVRVALQQSAITGSAEPLVATLKQADERLARYNQPRLERVRRAVVRDLDRVKAMAVVDISTLTIRLDEAVRLVDELPLVVSAPDARKGSNARPAALPASAAARVAAASAAAASASDASAAIVVPASETRAARALSAWFGQLADLGGDAAARVWSEVRALVRVTRIENPDAALVAPEQAFFIRENLKLRLLNARLALLSRQFDIAQSDLRDAQAMLDRYFERGAKRVATATELVRQVALQARQTSVPRPDETLAALTAAAAGR